MSDLTPRDWADLRYPHASIKCRPLGAADGTPATRLAAAEDRHRTAESAVRRLDLYRPGRRSHAEVYAAAVADERLRRAANGLRAARRLVEIEDWRERLDSAVGAEDWAAAEAARRHLDALGA